MNLFILLLVVLPASAQYATVGAVPLVISGGGASWAFVQQTSTSTCLASSGTQPSCVLGSAITNGNSAYLSYDNNSNLTVSSVSGGGCTWTAMSQPTPNGNRGSETWKGCSCTGGTTITVTMSGTITLNSQGNVAEFSGGTCTQDGDGKNTGNGGNGANEPSSTLFTPGTGENLLIIGAARAGGGNINASQPTALGTGTGCSPVTLNSPNSSAGYGYCIVTSTSGGTYGFKFTTSNTGNWAVSTAGVK